MRIRNLEKGRKKCTEGKEEFGGKLQGLLCSYKSPRNTGAAESGLGCWVSGIIQTHIASLSRSELGLFPKHLPNPLSWGSPCLPSLPGNTEGYIASARLWASWDSSLQPRAWHRARCARKTVKSNLQLWARKGCSDAG